MYADRSISVDFFSRHTSLKAIALANSSWQHQVSLQCWSANIGVSIYRSPSENITLSRGM